MNTQPPVPQPDCKPLARTDGLVVRELADELLVYDLERDKAHCLNPSAAFVWKQCDGHHTVDQIVASLREHLAEEFDERVAWYALAQLGKDHLLAERVAVPSLMTRQQMVRTLGIAALAVPMVSSIVAPTAAAAASNVPPGQSSTNPVRCQSLHPGIPPGKPIYGSGCLKEVKDNRGGMTTVCGTINAHGVCA